MGLNDSANGLPGGNGHGQANAANLAFTKFLFVMPQRLDDAAAARLRAVGTLIGRGFFNDFDIEGAASSGTGTPRDLQPCETIQFLVHAGDSPAATEEDNGWLARARYVVQVSSKYRPRLEEIAEELRRRLGDFADVRAIDGALRAPRYSSAELHHFVSKNGACRRSGRVSRNAVILPIRKHREWWEQSTLERNTYFYPHMDRASGCQVKGHAAAAEAGIPVLFRRLYHNPDGYERAGEYDFITYFECADDALPVFDRICKALRDPLQNPEWRYVEEGPMWRGRRILRW